MNYARSQCPARARRTANALTTCERTPTRWPENAFKNQITYFIHALRQFRRASQRSWHVRCKPLRASAWFLRPLEPLMVCPVPVCLSPGSGIGAGPGRGFHLSPSPVARDGPAPLFCKPELTHSREHLATVRGIAAACQKQKGRCPLGPAAFSVRRSVWRTRQATASVFGVFRRGRIFG